ncbi:Major Facilitator Superfamily protein [Clostridium frigidicarnis]|uniref:Major Facilitator Superfamily protein n=2 Tax=Clostridium frigidicarnis TaxID=84698 RepID=A0A1I1A6M6_9CLOT|nr:Major Facilitator Superfamily protein [Clostridium frigidicarnis]
MKTFNRNFNLMVLGQIISLFGAAILKFSLSLYILDLTGKAEDFATILAISTIPVIILSPIAGAIADRFNRRNLMVIFDFLSSTIVLALMLSLLWGNNSVFLIGVIMTLLSVVSTMYQPAVQASIPVLVDEDNLIKANGIVSGVSALTGIVGPILGGLLYGLVGLEAVVIVSCIAFFLSAVMEIFIQIPFTKKSYGGNIVTAIFMDIKEGLGYILNKNRFILKTMFIVAGINLFLAPMILVGVPYIVKIVMGADSTLFGIAQGAISFSTILAAIGIGVISKKLKIDNLYLWFVACGLLFIPMALSVKLVTSNLGFWIPFIFFTVSAMLILFAAATCATPLGQIIYGTLLDSFSDRVYITVLIAGAFTLVMGFVAKITLSSKRANF